MCVDTFQQHSSNDFINYFTSKIDTIRDQIVTMQPPATVSHQIGHYRSPEEQFHSFSTIGEEALYKLVKSANPTTCMLDPIPSKLLKEVLPEVIDPILSIIHLSLSLGYAPKTFKLCVIKPLIKKTQLDPKDLDNYRPISNLPFLSKIQSVSSPDDHCSHQIQSVSKSDGESAPRDNLYSLELSPRQPSGKDHWNQLSP